MASPTDCLALFHQARQDEAVLLTREDRADLLRLLREQGNCWPPFLTETEIGVVPERSYTVRAIHGIPMVCGKGPSRLLSKKEFDDFLLALMEG